MAVEGIIETFRMFVSNHWRLGVPEGMGMPPSEPQANVEEAQVEDDIRKVIRPPESPEGLPALPRFLEYLGCIFGQEPSPDEA